MVAIFLAVLPWISYACAVKSDFCWRGFLLLDSSSFRTLPRRRQSSMSSGSMSNFWIKVMGNIDLTFELSFEDHSSSVARVSARSVTIMLKNMQSWLCWRSSRYSCLVAVSLHHRGTNQTQTQTHLYHPCALQFGA